MCAVRYYELSHTKAAQSESEEINMPTYIVLMKLTDQGIKMVKDAPDRIEAAISSLEALGGKVNGFYATLGKYESR